MKAATQGTASVLRVGAARAAVFVAVAVPFALAASSPLLAWRDWIYIAAGFAGVAALGLLLVQPLVISDALGLGGMRKRRVHRIVGATLVALVVLHVGGLWITSPPDVVDALLFTSATPFSAWGVIAMWALFAAAGLAIVRRRLRYRTWQRAHLSLVVVIVAATIPHALLIEGTMETVSKVALCALVAAATAWAVWRVMIRRGST
ncbi:ferric reductase-like transmembrane domain-containing protein [Citreimonas sp.]|uniref:ferric reductase-like transmembrane domain-containing protein n=1 Tax=Citreimonas sp. TaxID=3036715 RepID=UPI0040589CC1